MKNELIAHQLDEMDLSPIAQATLANIPFNCYEEFFNPYDMDHETVEAVLYDLAMGPEE